MKYTKKNKKLLLVSIVLVIVTSMFLVLNNSHAYKELPKVKLKGDIKKSGLAIMVESDYNSGEYQKSDSNKFPTDGYTLNRIKSGCVDKNGNSVDALTYNGGNNGITIKTKQSVYCYLYYDNLFKGSGTEDSPYQINYIEDLVRLSNSVNKDLNVYKDKNFILMRDLDFNKNDSYMKYNDTGFGDINGVNNIEGIKEELTNREGTGFIPIGNLTINFQGNFDGNNKRLDNLYILNKIYNNRAGLFGTIENSIIKNLTISGSIDTTDVVDAGGIVGVIKGTVVIENCQNEINIQGKTHSTGGMVGAVSGNLTIKNSANMGTIQEGENAGGLVGCVSMSGNELIIENSYNQGQISNLNYNNAGGLLGRDRSDGNSITKIKNSYNIGDVTNAKSAEGGLIGGINGVVEIENSHNEGKISNTLGTYIGGLIGFSNNTSNITINNSYNANKVSFNSDEEKTIYLGGLIGNVSGKLNITNSYNTGDIENEKTDYAYGSFSGKSIMEGGLIAYINNNAKSYIDNSYNTGSILNGNGTGGIIGINDAIDTLVINRCYNYGQVSTHLRTGWSASIAGGLIGTTHIMGNTYILNSYNTASLESNYEAGGLVGENRMNTSGKYYVINSYNLGNVKGDRSASGVFNQYYVSSETHYVGLYYLNNVYNIGTISGSGSIKQSISYLNNTMDRTIKNAYYLDSTASTGTNLENDGELTTPMAETDMKSKTFVNTLNQKVTELNNAKLETIDENLKGYELEKWIQGSDDYPILTRKIEDLSGHGNHGKSYAVKYDKEGITTSTDENHLGYIDAGLRGHDFGNNFTMVVKFKFNSILDYNNLFGNWETGGMGISIRNINGTMNIVDAIYTDKYYSFTKQYDFKENEWYTIILTYDGALASDNLKLYINGVLHDTINVTGDVKTPVGDTIVAFGGNPKATWIQGQYSYATYKEALIFDRALTEEKDHISMNYKDDINVTNQDELLLWYKF